MKIIQVFNQYRFRGGEEAWVEHIPRLLQGHCEVEDLRFNSKDWTGDGAPSKLRQIRLMGDNPESRKALRQHTERFQPDAIVFHNVIPVGSFGLYFEAKKLGIHCLQYTHNFRPFSPGGTLWDGKKMTDAALHGNPWPEILAGAWQGSRLKTAILAWHLHRARKRGLIDCIDRWIAPSNFMRDQFVMAGIPRDRIYVLRHCWNEPIQANPEAEENHYLFLGRLVPEKGILNLIAAWRQLEINMGGACPKLVIAGTGTLEQKVQSAAKASPFIEYLGYVDGATKEQWIRRSRGILIPSICWESFGLTAYEAYALNRPVIAARVGALRETVINGQTGWHHCAGDPSDISRAIREAEEAGPDTRKQRGESGGQWLLQNADPKEWRTRMTELCR